MENGGTRFGWRSAAFGALVAAAMAGACGYSEEEMQAKVERIDALEAQLREAEQREEQAEARIAALEAQNQELGQRLRDLGEEVEGLESERVGLQSSLNETRSSLDETRQALEELRERQRQQQQRLAVFRGMLSRFRQMIDSGRLRVRIVRGRMVIELSNSILFASGRARLRDEGEQTLGEIVEVLSSIEDRQFQVAGHTDNVPIGRGSRFDSNWELSTARAVNVTRFMIEQGLSPTRISAAGYADTQPVASNDSEQGRAQNRRIEIALMPNLDELPDLSSLTDGEDAS